MEKQILEALELVRPTLQRDGGDVEFVSVDDEGVVTVKLMGACGGCPMATMTLKNFIEATLVDKVSGVKEVVSA